MNESLILESTYFDICTIKRKEKIKDPNTGVTTTVDVIKAQNIKCALSKKNNQIANQLEVGNLYYSHLLFINPQIDIITGDTVEVTSFGVTENYIANKPFKYVSHQEVYLTFKERV